MSKLTDAELPFPVGVNEFTTMPWTFEEEVEQYANLGIDSEIRRANRIFALQVSEWQTPHSFGDRLIPGYGSILLGNLLHAVHAIGYRDVCTIEIFSQDVPDSLYETDLRTVVQESRKGLDLAWRQAQI